jgi:DNA-binding NarL/FixJ family response regulator
MITIVVVDDHPVVREGLVGLLEDEPDFEVMGSAGSAEDAITITGQLRPAVIVLDLELPGMDGVSAIPHLLAASPEAKSWYSARTTRMNACLELSGLARRGICSKVLPVPRSPAPFKP